MISLVSRLVANIEDEADATASIMFGTLQIDKSSGLLPIEYTGISPLIKKVGVLVTPRSLPLCMSSSTRLLWMRSRNSRSNLLTIIPSLAADSLKLSSVRLCPCLNKKLYISQNFPCVAGTQVKIKDIKIEIQGK